MWFSLENYAFFESAYLMKMNYACDEPRGTVRIHPDHGNIGDEALNKLSTLRFQANKALVPGFSKISHS